MRNRVIVLATSVIAVLAGCGGNSNSSSPLQGGSLQGKEPVAATSRTIPANQEKGTLPVLLTIRPETLTQDIWCSLRGAELQSSDSQKQLLRFDPDSLMRLASLRDVEGRRFVFLGMADRGVRYVRAQFELSGDYWVNSVGEDPVKKSFSDVTKDGSSGHVLLKTNLDPNGDFKDALVLELNFAPAADPSGGLTPTMGLGSVRDALEADRQESFPVTMKITDPTMLSKDVCLLAKELPDKNADARVALLFDRATQRAGVVAVGSPEGGWIGGKVVSTSTEPRTVTLEPSFVPKSLGPKTSVELTVGEGVKPTGAEKWDELVGKLTTARLVKDASEIAAIGELRAPILPPVAQPVRSATTSKPKVTRPAPKR
ncbi:MAG: hypothetical protein JNM85_10510 [Chthonomonas sp.]|nr:hypothetical protein [Chthonomonas sp.]